MTKLAHITTTYFGVGIMDERWFGHRFELFEAITLPSIIGQTDKDFTWIIVIDAGMPKQSRDHLDKIVAPYGQIELLPIDPTRSRNPLRDRLSRAAAENDWLLTSRIDDDDAIELRSYERRRDAAMRFIGGNRGDSLLMFHPEGIEFHLARNEVRAYRYERPYTMGTSMLSRAETQITVLIKSHSKIADYAKDNNIDIELLNDSEPMWLYTRHSQADSIRGGRVLSKESGNPITDDLLRSYETQFGIIPQKIMLYLTQSPYRHLRLATSSDRRSSGLQERSALELQLRKFYGRQELGAASEEEAREAERLRSIYVELCKNIYQKDQ